MENIPTQHNEAPEGPTSNDAMIHIEGLRAQLHQWGNIDSENDDLDGIKQLLESGDISANEAIERANSLEASRNLR